MRVREAKSPRPGRIDRSAPTPAVRRRADGSPTLLFLLPVVWLLSAATLVAAPRPMRFETLTIEEGLSQNTVLTVFQDSRGFVWLGTEDGLNRYDGRSFTHYRHSRRAAEKGSLPGSYVWAVAEDSNGDLWIATDGGGVARWDRTRDRFSVFDHDPTDPHSLASNRTRAIFVDRRDAVWVGTRDRGLDRIDPATGRVSHFRHSTENPASLSHDEVLAVTADRSGVLWVGTADGLNRFDEATETFIRYRPDSTQENGIGGREIRALHEDRAGTLWIGTRDGGLSALDLASSEIRRYRHDPEDPRSIGHDTVRAILEDRDGRIWIATPKGLDLLDRESGEVTRYVGGASNAAHLVSHDVMALHEDRTGLIWVGTKSGGVSRWNPRTWSFGHQTAGPEGLGHSVVTSFSEGPAGDLWVGTMGGGLNRLERRTGTWSRHGAGEGGLGSDLVMSLRHDQRGDLWIGTMDAGLRRLDPQTGEIVSYRRDPVRPGTLSADAIMTIFEDRNAGLWIGTFRGGLNRYERSTDSFSTFAADPEDPTALASSIVTSLAQDMTGALWVGTDGGGLHLFDPRSRTFRRYRHDPVDPSTLGSDTVYSLHVDASGVLWVGTRGAGINRLVGSARAPEEIRFEAFSTTEGLANADVYGIRSDLHGNLWISTNAGLSRFDPRAQSFTNFSRGHGLQASEFNFGAHYRSSSGELFFGGVNGFNAFHPAALEINQSAPPVVLSSVMVNHHALETLPTPGERLRLGHRDDILLFEFAALDYTDPEANRYAYMLEGFDEDWVDLDSGNRVSYTNLAAGDYRLRVRAANSDGVWNEEGLALEIAVAPAPWTTWWARLLYVSVTASLLVGFVQVQRRKVEREEEYSRLLEEDVRLRTGELEDRNSELQALNSKLLEASLTDSLTGLRNRRFFFEQVAKDIAMVRRRYYQVASGAKDPEVFDLVFLMVDLDHFKSINDSCGHSAGDRVLLQVRNILLDCCRESDIVIRWGGDEFLIIARDTVGTQAEVLSERIRSCVETSVFELGNGQVARTTCSIGFACFPFVHSHPDAVTWEQVLQFADSAMYTAKRDRDAWIGFMSTETTLANEGVLRMIRDTPGQLVDDGSLKIVRSPRRGAESVAEGVAGGPASA